MGYFCHYSQYRFAAQLPSACMKGMMKCLLPPLLHYSVLHNLFLEEPGQTINLVFMEVLLMEGNFDDPFLLLYYIYIFNTSGVHALPSYNLMFLDSHFFGLKKPGSSLCKDEVANFLSTIQLGRIINSLVLLISDKFSRLQALTTKLNCS